MVIAKGGEGGIRTLHFLAWAIISKTRSLGRVFYCPTIMVVSLSGGRVRILHFLTEAIILKTRSLF
jgi:ribosomal 50S subunit-recycling heat shock protein